MNIHEQTTFYEFSLAAFLNGIQTARLYIAKLKVFQITVVAYSIDAISVFFMLSSNIVLTPQLCYLFDPPSIMLRLIGILQL